MEAIIIFSLLSLVVVLLLNYYVANCFMTIAEHKGFDDRKYFHICFWLGMVGYLMVVALPDLRSRPAPPQAPVAPAVPSAPTTQTPATAAYTGETGGTAQATLGTYSLQCKRCSLWQSKNNRVCTQCGATFTDFI